jgi:hypothetical protein
MKKYNKNELKFYRIKYYYNEVIFGKIGGI